MKKLLTRIGKIILSYLWGIALAAVILFPAVYAFLHNARGGAELGMAQLFLQDSYYKELFESFVVANPSVNYWAIPGIGVLGIFSMCVLIAHWKKADRKILLGFGVLLVMMIFPYAGKIMNGFSYPTMRFSYGMALLLTIMFVYAMYAIKEIKIIPTSVSSLLFAVICVYLIYNAGSIPKPGLFYAAAILGFVCIAVILSYLVLRDKKYGQYILYILTLVAVVNIAYSCYSMFDKNQYYRCETYVDRGKTLEEMKPGEAEMMMSVNNDSFYRVERYEDVKNISTFFGFHQTGFYWSIVPSEMTDLFVSTCTSDYYPTCIVKGLERRIGLLALSSTKYYVNYAQNAPFGFRKIDEKIIHGRKVYLYENEYYLPIGVSYTSYMTRKQYERLNPVEREQALLTSAVVDEKMEGIENNSKVTGAEMMPLRVEKTRKMEINDFGFNTKKGAAIHYAFDGEPDSQTYIVFKNLHSKDIATDQKPARYQGENAKGQMRVVGNFAKNYFQKDGSVLNLGYSKEAKKEFQLEFRKKRKYTFDDAYAVSVPISNYIENIEKLKKNTLEIERMEENLITGKIKANQEEILQVSVPYSKGYSVYVDGKKCDCFKSSMAYLGFKITKGNHKIEIRYRTPLLLLGFVITIISAIMFAVYILLMNRKNKRILMK